MGWSAFPMLIKESVFADCCSLSSVSYNLSLVCSIHFFLKSSHDEFFPPTGRKD